MTNFFTEDDVCEFEILKPLGVLDKENVSSTMFTKEVNLISWNGGLPKVDIRKWDVEHTHMTKGVTFKESEFEIIKKLIKDWLLKPHDAGEGDDEELSEDDFKFKIVEQLGVIATYPTGWTRELNYVSWNGDEPMLDIREWDPSHSVMTTGIRLSLSEAEKLLTFAV